MENGDRQKGVDKQLRTCSPKNYHYVLYLYSDLDCLDRFIN